MGIVYYIVTEKQTFTIQQKLVNMKFTAIFIGAMMMMLLAHTSFAEFSEGQIETDEQAQDNPAAGMEVKKRCDSQLCRLSRGEEEMDVKKRIHKCKAEGCRRGEEEMEVKKRCNTLLCRIQRGEEIEVKKRCNTMLCRIQRGEEIIVHKKRCSAFKCRITRGAEEIEVKKKNCNGNWCRISR